MEKCNTYVYFALKGDDFDPREITRQIGIDPTSSWRKGDQGKYNPMIKNSCWQLSTEKGKEYIEVDKLVNEIVTKLISKIDVINKIKHQFHLESVMEVVLDIDINPEVSTPAIGHDLQTIEFLYKTKTITDVDIYRFDSRLR
jgi:hypothetical protein